ncbi:BTE_HP_G0221960.mRNA.1.CDS.1 [Saccharomyces cerevisiae]|nr:BTE_HP_G0221960.mRNA.1.CDS.1 [Saccharomyces cerevisiae]CAI6435860.1 BTE_HP_G0221960.mRNA.1.CDS.1 [Saccharomyces cerevisiae]
MGTGKTNFQYGVKTDEHGNLNQFSFSNEMMNNIMAKVDAPKAQDLQKVKKFLLKRSQVASFDFGRANVDRQLDIIEKNDMHRKLFTNMGYNKAAVAVAQSNHQKKTEFHNKINMGGGLFLSPEDITKIASGLISPVLGEAELSTKEARLKQLEVDSLINERKERLNATEIELKKEKLNLLEAMKMLLLHVAMIRLTKKVKKLIGMTSEEYLTQNKSVEKNVEDLPTQLEKIEEGDELKKEE